jgi:hypothetical protein
MALSLHFSLPVIAIYLIAIATINLSLTVLGFKGELYCFRVYHRRRPSLLFCFFVILLICHSIHSSIHVLWPYDHGIIVRSKMPPKRSARIRKLKSGRAVTPASLPRTRFSFTTLNLCSDRAGLRQK